MSLYRIAQNHPTIPTISTGIHGAIWRRCSVLARTRHWWLRGKHVMRSAWLTGVLFLTLGSAACVRTQLPAFYPPDVKLPQAGCEAAKRDIEECQRLGSEEADRGSGKEIAKSTAAAPATRATVGDRAEQGERSPVYGGGPTPPHIRAVQTFLLAWGKERWDEVRTVAAERVRVMLGGKVFLLDLTAGKTDVAVVFPFRGISTFRVEGEVKGVTLEEIGLKAGESKKRGPGTVTLEEKNGEYRVTTVAVE